jgi:Pyruvate/2-oxoacid:ferredoxin oxidoreductase delta subunit
MLKAVDDCLKVNQADATKLSDLCGLAANRKDLLNGLMKPGTEFLVIGCYRRTMDMLFQQVSLKTDYTHINLYQEKDADAVVEQISSFLNGETGAYNEIKEDSGWPSWYPVLDYSRCTSCGQCADFCLFGVYEKTESLVKVVHPNHCKNNCPACARICPSTAIIFPKYKNGGAISGSGEIDEVAEHQRKLQDIESIMGDDIYAALAQRKAKRQSIIREEVLRKANEERNNALNEQKNS